MPKSTVTSKGQITIPKAVRDALAVGPGDRLAFIVGDDGRVTVEPETVDLRQLAGTVKARVRGVTLADMEAAIRRKGGGKV